MGNTTTKVATPLSALENIALTSTKDGSSIVSQSLWSSQPSLIILLRRPGCLLCRDEAVRYHKLRSTIEKEYGIRMAAIVHEKLGATDFADNYWCGDTYFDQEKKFFMAIGGGKLRWGGYMDIFKPSFLKRYKEASSNGVKGNLEGEGRILGGLYIVAPGRVIYEYPESEFGDHAPVDEVMEILKNVSNEFRKVKNESNSPSPISVPNEQPTPVAPVS